MRRSLLLSGCLTLSLACFSQKIPLIRSGEVIHQAVQLYDSGKYAEAIAKFLLVPQRDTNYVYMLSELSLAYIANKENEKAIEVCNEGLSKPSDFKSHLIRSRGIATDNKGDFDTAVKIFQEGLSQYPFDFSMLYNLGITYYNHKDYDKAIDCFFKVLSVNPYHAGSHLNLGRISIGQGRRTHAMLSFGVYLAIRNGDHERLVLLEKFLNNQYPEESSITAETPNAFERLDQIIHAKIALDSKFKPKVPIDAVSGRQYQMLFEQLQTADATIDDKWLNYYLPLYKSLNESNSLEAFTYHIFASIKNDDVKKWLKKNESKLTTFYDLVNKGLKAKREIIPSAARYGFSNPVHAFYTENNQLESLGEKDAKGNEIGRWVYFHDNNEVSAEGNFNDEGKKSGLWKFYFNTGLLKSTEDEESGEVKIFRENGQLDEKFTLKDDSVQGEGSSYYTCGAAKEITQFNKGKRDGPGKSFYASGKIKSTYQYDKGNTVGEYKSYFENGQIESTAAYSNGNLQGEYLEYWSNGKLRVTGHYANDEYDGLWTYYYSNGKIERSGKYKASLVGGEWTYYDQRGNLMEKRNFNEKGNFEGVNTFYRDGKVEYQKTFKDDVLIGVVLYDENGKELKKFGNPNGTFSVTYFFQNGQMSSEGSYKKGRMDGLWKYYFHNGAKKSEFNYVDGQLQGAATQYFKSGKQKTSLQYKDDKLDGYYQEFYDQGGVKEEGWFQEGQRQQQWLNYYPNDSIETDAYYLNDQLKSFYREFTTDGKLFAETIYDAGKLVNEQLKNSNGNVITKKTENNGSSVFETTYLNGKVQSRAQLTCGLYSGSVSQWFPEDKLYFTYPFMNGRRHGAYQMNTLSGITKLTGNYLDGEEDGLWKGYYNNGALEYEGYYLKGESDSTWTFYYPNGKTFSSSNYLDEDRVGVSKVYSPEGTLLFEKRYDGNDLVSYRVMEKEERLGDWIKFTGNATLTAYYKNGKQAWEETYRNGMLDGVRRIYFATGKLFSEYNYTQGDNNGPYSMYYPNGQLLEKGNYSFDVLDGLVEVYNEDGTLKQSEHFRSGVRHGKALLYNKGVKTKEYNFWAGKVEE